MYVHVYSYMYNVSVCTQTCMPIPALPRCSSERFGCLQAELLSLSLAAQSWEWLSEHPLPVHDSAHPFGYHTPVHIYMYMYTNINTALIGHAMVYIWCNLYIVHALNSMITFTYMYMYTE